MAQSAAIEDHDRHLADFVQQHQEVWHPDGSSCNILKAINAANGGATHVEPEERSSHDRALDAVRAFCEQWFGSGHTVTWQRAHEKWHPAVRDPAGEIIAVAYGSPAGSLEQLASQVRSAIR